MTVYKARLLYFMFTKDEWWVLGFWILWNFKSRCAKYYEVHVQLWNSRRLQYLTFPKCLQGDARHWYILQCAMFTSTFKLYAAFDLQGWPCFSSLNHKNAFLTSLYFWKKSEFIVANTNTNTDLLCTIMYTLHKLTVCICIEDLQHIPLNNLTHSIYVTIKGPHYIFISHSST